MNKNKVTKIVISALISLFVIGCIFYFALPAINIFYEEFWILLCVSALIVAVPIIIILSKESVRFQGKGIMKISLPKWAKTTLITIIAVPIGVMIIGGIVSSTFLNAKKFAGIIEVNEGVFQDDMPQSSSVSNIALMDSTSAEIIGNKELGELSDVVSQYELSHNYTQINYQKKPQKITNLEYADFFRWVSNRKNGVPGFVMVDPVKMDADYHSLSKPMKYVESGYFGDDLVRKLRFSYPTKIFGSIYFEIDEDANPYYIVSCLKPKVGLFGAKDVSEVIIFNPCDGSSEIYPVAETPAWVDIVYTGNLASQKYNWQGILSGGYFNSIIGKKNCKKTTDDFGYIVIGDDVWYFTGVTSLASDQSNIGFIISNARTGEYRFYPVIGVDEHSAMAAAQGEVQEKGYVASFPSLVNISGQASYIMVLKDNYGYVKLYAIVNVEKVKIVATGDSQKSAIEEYVRLLSAEGIISGDTALPEDKVENKEITVSDVRIAEYKGESVVYVTSSDGDLYKKELNLDEKLMLIRKGDVLNVKYTKTEVDSIYAIISFEIKK